MRFEGFGWADTFGPLRALVALAVGLTWLFVPRAILAASVALALAMIVPVARQPAAKGAP